MNETDEADCVQKLRTYLVTRFWPCFQSAVDQITYFSSGFQVYESANAAVRVNDVC